MVVGDVPSPSGSAMPRFYMVVGDVPSPMTPRFYMVVGVLF